MTSFGAPVGLLTVAEVAATMRASRYHQAG